MKTLKTVSLISAFIGLAGVLLAPAAVSAPGKGWDVFNARQGDAISVSDDSARSVSAGKGWDTYNQGQGAPIPSASKAYAGTSSAASAGQGWDTFFYTGEGSRL